MCSSEISICSVDGGTECGGAILEPLASRSCGLSGGARGIGGGTCSPRLK